MGSCITDRLGIVFDAYVYVITLGIDEVIELDFSYIYLEGCNYDRIEGLVTGFQYGINDVVVFEDLIFDGK